jgi:hypothetical protein
VTFVAHCYWRHQLFSFNQRSNCEL